MMHSRGGFVLSENQAFAAQSRTPGPSRLHASPTRKTMTTGKRAMGQTSKLFGQDAPAGSKQLFQDSKSPVKALGDRNALKTPGRSRQTLGKPNASGLKDKLASGSNQESTSPTKKGASELSPRKATTSNALRSLNGKQRQPNADAAGANLKTPAPTLRNGKARTMSRQNSFVTPAANVGRAGQIKARMGEMLDAEMGLSLQKSDGAVGQLSEAPVVQMSEEEMYPEIEYMPPSLHAKHPVFEFPDELDDLPRAKQLGAQLSAFTATGFSDAAPDDLSDVEVPPMQPMDEADLCIPSHLGAVSDDDDDDDPWPDVAVTVVAPSRKADRVPAPVPSAVRKVPAASLSSARAGVAAAPSTVASVRAKTQTASRAAPIAAAKAPAQPMRGLQRSIAAPNQASKLASSTTSSGVRRAGAATVRASTLGGSGVERRASSTAPKAAGPTAVRASSAAVRAGKAAPAAAPAAARTSKMVLNPKLIDFVDDELGKQTEATLRELDEQEDVAALQLDLGGAVL